jgi:hypothetical protein
MQKLPILQYEILRYKYLRVYVCTWCRDLKNLRKLDATEIEEVTCNVRCHLLHKHIQSGDTYNPDDAYK